jgi:hypothetical protein
VSSRIASGIREKGGPATFRKHAAGAFPRWSAGASWLVPTIEPSSLPLLHPHPRPATILGNELDTSFLKGAT